jgi:hypothetical protein
VPLRILTDEHISPEFVAHRLAALGYDVVPARDRGLAARGTDDWEILRSAISEERAVCTYNQRHFERLHRDWTARGDVHAGILVAPSWTDEELFWALREYLELSAPDDLISEIVYLPAASPEFIATRQ